MHLWNPALHHHVANEQLVFVMAGFDPVYKRETVVGETKTTLRRLGVRSYSIWELIGEHDLMIQSWLPRGLTANALVEALGKMSSSNGIDTLTMAVDEIVHHWMWESPIDVQKIELAIDPADYVALNGPPPGVPRSRTKRYEDAGYIHRAPSTRAMKFFLRITNPFKATNAQVRAEFLRIARRVLTAGNVENGVLMTVKGDGGSYLLTGRLKPHHYEDISNTLRHALGGSGLLEFCRCRTVTHVSALATPLDRREQLLPTQAEDATVSPDTDELASWLLQAESDHLEFKASAFTDIEHAIGNRQSPRKREDCVKEIAKAVTGFLNASGGTVVIGVAETDRLSGDKLRRRFPDALAAGTRLVLGVDHEFAPRGGWDQYQRTLAANLRKQITGEFDGWVRYHDVDYEGVTICVLKVRRSKGWHYLESRDRNGTPAFNFYGRAGGETRHLPPPEADQFKEAHPRLSSIDPG